MSSTQLTSVRIEKDVLARIEKLTAGKKYWSRAHVINRLMAAMLSDESFRCAECILTNYWPFEDTCELHCTITDRKGKITKI